MRLEVIFAEGQHNRMQKVILAHSQLSCWLAKTKVTNKEKKSESWAQIYASHRRRWCSPLPLQRISPSRGRRRRWIRASGTKSMRKKAAAAVSARDNKAAAAVRSAREKVGNARSARGVGRSQRGGDAPRRRRHCRCRWTPPPPASSRAAGFAAIVVAVHRPPRAPLDSPSSLLQSVGLLVHLRYLQSEWERERERIRMRSGGESKREGEGAVEEPSPSLPRPLAPDPPAIVTLIPTAPVGLGWEEERGRGENRGRWRRGRGEERIQEERGEEWLSKKIFLRDKRGRGRVLYQAGLLRGPHVKINFSCGS